MLQTLKNAWKTKEIRSKIIFTLFILLLYRIGTVIPVPFVEANGFAESFSGTILDYLNTLSGGSLGTATLFALGVQPYINASIILQLLGVVFPKLGELAKNDKKKMSFITRCVTVLLALVTAFGYYWLLRTGNLTNAATPGEGKAAWFYGVVIIACYCAGASLVMWLADRINEKGIGNGISLILFANIIAAVPSFAINLSTLVIDTFSYYKSDYIAYPWVYSVVAIIFALALLALVIGLTIFVILVTGSERRIPVQYAKKVVGRKMYGGQSSHLPIKLNMTGVMPIIFASSIVSLLPTILVMCGVSETGTGFWSGVARVFSSNGVVYPVMLFILIIAFSYFYSMISFDPIEVANNLKRNGGAIPGIRQGRPTSDYIKKILNKITLAGALFLAIIAILPIILGPHAIQYLLEWIIGAPYKVEGMTELYYSYIVQPTAQSLTSTFSFGGTTLLIVVGVAIETYRELEAQLTMRNYKGFLN